MIQLCLHPDYETINSELSKWIDFLPDSDDVVTNLVVEKHTDFYTYPKCFLDLKDWVLDISNYNENSVYQLWAAVYNYGDFAHKHTHNPSTLSFVYYVEAPEGSSPLVFDDFEVLPQNGLCVIFGGNVSHHVPKNKCNGRKVIAGNFKEELPL